MQGDLPGSDVLNRQGVINITFLSSNECVLCHRGDSGLVTSGSVLKNIKMSLNAKHSKSSLVGAALMKFGVSELDLYHLPLLRHLSLAAHQVAAAL